jgi:hypothetical protein
MVANRPVDVLLGDRRRRRHLSQPEPALEIDLVTANALRRMAENARPLPIQ